MDTYLKEAFIPAMHRTRIKHIGVFKPRDAEEASGKLIYVLIPFEDITQFEKLEKSLKNDESYQRSASDYIYAPHDEPPYERMESILLRAFASMPEYGIPGHLASPADRVYELRSYQGATEERYEKKVEMFTCGGETKIFQDLGFQPLFFGEVISGPDMPNLMYMISFENQEAQDVLWDKFRNAPAWDKLKADKQYEHTVSKIDKFMLHPTDYSDL